VLHFAGPNHHTQDIVDFDETTATDETKIQVGLLVPSQWCRAMTEGDHFTAGDKFYCKSHFDAELVPMAFNTKWSNFTTSADNPEHREVEFNVSKLGHKFKLVWKQNSAPSKGRSQRGRRLTESENRSPVFAK
jgi:hypothetical protein